MITIILKHMIFTTCIFER